MDIRNAIDAELPAVCVPLSLTPDLAVVLGRRARLRRRLILGGTGVLPVAAGVVALVLPLGTTGGGTADPSPPPATTLVPPEIVVPRGEVVVGVVPGPATGPAETDDTRDYTAAFWSYFTERYPGVRLRGIGPDGPRPDPTGPIDQHGQFQRGVVTMEIAAGYEETSEAIERFRYRLEQVQGNEMSDALAVLFPDRDGLEDRIGVEVYPAGSHHPDAGDTLDLAAYHYVFDGFVHLVQEVTGPTGEAIRYVTVEDATTVDMPDIEAGRYVVLYRQDGSAVVVSDATPSATEDGFMSADERYSPHLSFEELVEIATALPLLPVD